MRKTQSVCINKTLVVDAKSLKKGDRIWVGRRAFTVKSNAKDVDGNRAIHLKWGSRKKKDDVHLVVPPKMQFNVHLSDHTRTK